ncbi:MAG: DUF4159 domain-containing protein [Alphaproteobacteria bacterium]|nr:DUF4159 domain-containing protein [Alphaproteobacteria bacterium]
MGILSSLSFTAPWVLLGLGVLPVIYWLLRITPPRPRRMMFPPLRLLLGLMRREETPSRTPWWLLLLRLGIAALVIIALAGPMTGGNAPVKAGGPLVLFVDNGWPAAQGWNRRADAISEALRKAQHEERAVVIVATAADNNALSLLDAAAAARTANTLKPQPWLPDREKAVAALAKLHFAAKPDIRWLSDGMDYGDARKVAAGLREIGTLSVFADARGVAALALLPPSNGTQGFQAAVVRGAAEGTRTGAVEALGRNGEIFATAPFHFAPGKTQSSTTLKLPLEIRNKTTRLQIVNQSSAGAVQLLDAANRRRAVGLVSASNSESQQPLLSDLFYLQRALSPYADLYKGTIDTVLDHNVSVLVLADIGRIAGSNFTKVEKFVEDGGLLIRFAGGRMAEKADSLVPVRLRSGGRYLGSALSWAEPQHLAPFPATSPFAGLPVPNEVTVSRQVLAEPSVQLAEHSWARLADGTPLVTATQRGKGWIVLFHVTAGPAWSSLPLSGLYVDMLRRLLPLAGGAKPSAVDAGAVLPARDALDGFGRLHKAPADAIALKGAEIGRIEPSAKHPPGFYGAEGADVALNTVKSDFRFVPFGDLGTGIAPYAAVQARTLGPLLLAAAAALLLFDMLIGLGLRGLIPWPRRAAAGAAALLFCIMLVPPNAHAADSSFAMQAALDTRLAYVKTGVADVDAMSHAGLVGLDVILTQRTSYEPQPPMGVDLETDDLSFFPLLYWPMDPREKDLSPKALAKISDYMKNGGTILFDTRDLTLGAVRGEKSPGEQTLRRLVSKLDMPPLEPIPADHVLTKAFYIIQDFPGRWDGGTLWVQQLPKADPETGPAPARGGDGVSPVVIGGNDWAAAWAVDNQGRPLVAVVPGGERQREMAYRFGVNLVMYALTGNYKTDQVHVPALLERLGQ